MAEAEAAGSVLVEVVCRDAERLCAAVRGQTRGVESLLRRVENEVLRALGTTRVGVAISARVRPQDALSDPEDEAAGAAARLHPHAASADARPLGRRC